MTVFRDMVDPFEECPICSGRGDVVYSDYSPTGDLESRFEDCTYCGGLGYRRQSIPTALPPIQESLQKAYAAMRLKIQELRREKRQRR